MPDADEAITTVAARLGHRDTSTTLKVYGHLMPGADERAAGIVGSSFAGTSKADAPHVDVDDAAAIAARVAFDV